jgi:CheY-like chemotaxis protein
LRECFDVVEAESPIDGLANLPGESAGIYLASDHLDDGLKLGRMLKNERILEGMPDGVTLLDAENTIIWANDCLKHWLRQEDLAGCNFYRVFGNPEILGPDFCPFTTALASREASTSTLRCVDNRYYYVHCVPFLNGDGTSDSLIVTVRDITAETLQQQKLAAIHKAGVDLTNLTAEEVFQMHVQDRIELLKSNILQDTKDLLNFDVIEIRLKAQDTGELVPLLSVGMDDAANERQLFALPQGQGVTGFVAATGKSYLCEDTAEDPLYIEGCVGAKSSLTVPLIQHDNKVIGTFNVESPEPHAFTESDLQFLEIYSRDVANALNTLELLVAQQANTAQASVEAIHREVALPVDRILNDVAHILEEYIGHNPAVSERLRSIRDNARDIKQLIHKVGQQMTPSEAVPASAQIEPRPALIGRRILVVDDDEAVLLAAHNLLERYSCTVETARRGNEAIYMIRNAGSEMSYDVIISDLKLPDMSGFDLLMKLKEQLKPEPVPLILMSGFGYDMDHNIPKARQAGLPAHAVLFKPFRLDQLLSKVEATITLAKPSDRLHRPEEKREEPIASFKCSSPPT